MIHAIHICPTPAEPMQSVNQVLALPGVGLEGDRYALREGTFSKTVKDFELTLIEIEAIEAVNREHGFSLTPALSRRNLATRGIRLNPLVGQRFFIGAVLCEATRLCEPCSHLEKLTGNPNLRKVLAGRCGLRAKILSQGIIRIGDAISLAPPA
jgi:MOSC domain-containing protein YiiM